MAYGSLASKYSVLGEWGPGSEYYTKAFELRDHASEREKLIITASYYQVRGELDKAAQAFQEMVDNFRDILQGVGL